MSDWELIYTSDLPHRIEIVLQVLKDQDIDAVKMDKRDSSLIVMGTTIELYAKKEDAILAKIIIEQNQL